MISLSRGLASLLLVVVLFGFVVAKELVGNPNPTRLDREMLTWSLSSLERKHKALGLAWEPVKLAPALKVQDFTGRALEIARRRAVYVGTDHEFRLRPKMGVQKYTYAYTLIDPLEPLGTDMLLRDKTAIILVKHSAYPDTSSIAHVAAFKHNPSFQWNFEPLANIVWRHTR